MRYAFRLLIKSPLFTSVAVLTLALGIGANTAVFSVVYGVLLKQLPFPYGSRLVWIWGTHNNTGQTPYSIPDFMDLRRYCRTLDGLAAHIDHGATLGGAGEPERFVVDRISANAFQLMGVTAWHGRTLVEADGKPDSERVLVMTYGLWQRRFGAVPTVIGQKLVLDGESYTVAGVLPPEFIMPATIAELFVPLVFETDPLRGERGNRFLRVFGRLRPGATRQQAAAELAAITGELRQKYPATNATRTNPSVVSLQDQISGGYRSTLWALLGAVGLLLLITCANLANLLLARASDRNREMAIRSALGATRTGLIRQLFAESLALAAVGGTLGVLLAKAGLRTLLAFSPASMPRTSEIGLDLHVLSFAAAVTIACTVLFGLAPGLHASRAGFAEAMNARGITRGRSSTARSFLVVAEIALSVVLLLSAGLMFKSFLRMQAVNPGFTPDHVLILRLSLPRGSYETPRELRILFEKVRLRMNTLSGIESLGLVSQTPLSGVNATDELSISGRRTPSPLEKPIAEVRWISAGYFRAMRIPLLEGRDFTDADIETSHGVAVVDQAFVKKYWPGESALGHHVGMEDHDFEVVGVVGDVKHFALSDGPTPTVYAPFPQATVEWLPYVRNSYSLAARTTHDPLALANIARRELRAADAAAPPATVRTLDQFVASALAPRRFTAELTTVFAGVALVLAGVGLYGVVTYFIVLRTGEIGIRIALGAAGGDIFRLVMGQGLKLLLVGACFGMLGAGVAGRLITSMLFGTSAADPSVVGAVCAVVTLLGAIALYFPTRRAARVDPAITLRSE